MRKFLLPSLVLFSAILFTDMSQAKGKHNSNKMSYTEARKECQNENPSIKGKALRECVKEKRAAKK